MDRNVVVIAKSALDHFLYVTPPVLITFDHAHVIFLVSNRVQNNDSILAYEYMLSQLCPFGVHPVGNPHYSDVEKFVHTQCKSYVGIARSVSLYSLRSFYFSDFTDAVLFKLTFC